MFQFGQQNGARLKESAFQQQGRLVNKELTCPSLFAARTPSASNLQHFTACKLMLICPCVSTNLSSRWSVRQKKRQLSLVDGILKRIASTRLVANGAVTAAVGLVRRFQNPLLPAHGRFVLLDIAKERDIFHKYTLHVVWWRNSYKSYYISDKICS